MIQSLRFFIHGIFIRKRERVFEIDINTHLLPQSESWGQPFPLMAVVLPDPDETPVVVVAVVTPLVDGYGDAMRQG